MAFCLAASSWLAREGSLSFSRARTVRKADSTLRVLLDDRIGDKAGQLLGLGGVAGAFTGRPLKFSPARSFATAIALTPYSYRSGGSVLSVQAVRLQVLDIHVVVGAVQVE